MAKPFSQLPNILEQRKNQFLKGADRITREAARAGGATAVETTRVDTGRARSNWIASIGAPSGNVIPPYAPGSKLGIGERGNALGATNQHRLTIATWKPSRGAPLFIANNLPYIFSLNFGGPNVSPGNMLALARQAWRVSIMTNIRKIFKD